MTTLIDALCCIPVLTLWFGPAAMLVLLSMHWASTEPKDDLRPV